MTAVPPTRNVQTSLVSNFTPGTGYAPQQNIQQYALPPPLVANPPLLVGVDYVVMAVVEGVNPPITFPNLPIRGQNNPNSQTQNQPQTLAIAQGDLLLFEVSCSDAPVTSIILNSSNLQITAPSVSTGTYKAFQAVVNSDTIQTVTVWGRLYLAQGAAS